MPRLLSPGLIIEKNQLESNHTFTMCFELTIQGAPGPFRLVNYDQDILFAGLLFQRFPVTVDLLEEASSAALVTIRLTAANVDQSVQSLLENYWGSIVDPRWMCTIWQIDASIPDNTPFESGELFVVDSVTTDFISASFELTAEGITLGSIVPGRRYTTSSGFANIPRR